MNRLPTLIAILFLGLSVGAQQTDSTSQHVSLRLDNSISPVSWCLTPSLAYRYRQWQGELGYGITLRNNISSYKVDHTGANYIATVRYFIKADNPFFEFSLNYTNKQFLYNPSDPTKFRRYSMEHFVGYGMQTDKDRRIVFFHDFGIGVGMTNNADPNLLASYKSGWAFTGYMRVGVSYRFLK